MYKNKGFTLIELVIVIIVLGILAAVAIPRFINIQQDARIAVIKGIAGNFSFVVDQVNYAAIMQGLDDQSRVEVDVGGVVIETYYGKPKEIWGSKLAELMNSNIHYLGNGNDTPTILGEECSQAPICVVDQTKAGNVPGGFTQGWGMFFIPQGKSVTDQCYAFYAFEVDYGAGVIAYSEVSTIETGC
ncbi:prepilin-type N-terminal cleavage/methylation domain-containing protein [Moritella dasanensis]|uniref:prepilin-type N-terminal cleavage/methylation domain-containing protein n=1 Tax=Moritella dasanensis TaxID=428031 RepID=UPI0002FE7F9F|nr:prepilin-type N-terminal cleavage/methylation domain-containing protein [Moritella dasanensis]